MGFEPLRSASATGHVYYAANILLKVGLDTLHQMTCRICSLQCQFTPSLPAYFFVGPPGLMLLA